MYFVYECIVFEGYKNIKNKNGYYLIKVFILEFLLLIQNCVIILKLF